MTALRLAPPPEEPEDGSLVAAFYAGDESAFEVLYARYRGRVIAYAQQMLRSREEAEDVCVEAFVKVLEGSWRPVGSFRAFLFTVAHRACLQRLRRRKITDRVLSLFGSGWGSDEAADSALLRDERTRRLAGALSGLSEDHRSVVLLFYTQDLPTQEIAAVLGVTDQQVRSRLSYARKRLREILGPEEEP